jgi:eukaryotic-like serine/threonine-protein kinase
MSEVGDTRAPQAGDVLAGKYEVERVLGEGGMGIVVAARHRQLDQKVALKFMHEGVAKIAIQRFMKEAKAVAKLRSENVARVMDVGTLENGAPYIVMEYLEGEDLSALSKQGVVPIADAIDYVLQASVALAEAHASGIVHRDIKPGNLFLTRRPDGSPLVKVLDFGISKMQSTDAEVDGSTTRTGTVMGSPAYMSPEQVRSSKLADARSDIWSLGVVLFHLVTGKMPFDAETVPDMFVAILHEPARTATSANPALPPQLDEVFARCFAKEASGRYQNLSERSSRSVPSNRVGS